MKIYWIFVILICGIAAIAYSQTTNRSGLTWEYKVMDIDDKGGDQERQMRLQNQLAPLGVEGWELVEMPYLKGVRYQVMVLKRAVR